MFLAPAGAQTLDEMLGPETVLPPATARVRYEVEVPLAEDASPEALARDPRRLAAFFRQDPERLGSDRMTPELARMLAGILLRGNETFLAETLLHNAAKRWPKDAETLRAWGRVLISLGRPEAARRALDTAVAANPKDPTAHYLLGRALMAIDPQDPVNQAKVLAAFEATLAAAPEYVDSDGVGAAEIRAAIAQIKQNRSPSGAATSPPASSASDR